MKILVTGGCGFIGSNFIYHILKKYPNYEIINIDNLTYAGNLANLEKLREERRYKFVKGNICDAKLVNELVKEVDLIVHFAAESHVDRSIQNSAEFVMTNVLGTQILLEAARKNGNKRFHHVSTDEVFGSLTKHGKFNENTSYNPRNPYSASKAASDHFVRAYFHTYGLLITISNCTNNYGPYQFPEKLIPKFVTNLLEGKKVPIHGNGLDIRDWVHVEDHNEAVDLIIHKGKIGETYCIGGNTEMTNIDLARMILKILNQEEEMIIHTQNRAGHDFRYAIDFSKIRNELGWEPKIDFEKGLKETVEWYKNNERWWKPLKQIVKENPDKITL